MTATLLTRPDNTPADLTDDLTRRRFVGAGSAALATLLTGCGADRSLPTPSGPATRTVQDMTGRTVEVPVTPDRVVLLDAATIGGPTATLGYVPLAMASVYPDGIARLQAVGGTAPELAAVPIVGTPIGLDLEAIAALGPDLIIGDWFQTDQLDALTAIAPTFMVDMADWRRPPLEAQRVLTDLLGLGEEFAARLAAYETAVAGLRDRLGVTGCRFSYLDVESLDVLYLYDYPYQPHRIVLHDLGIAPTWGPAVFPAGDRPNVQISAEEIGGLDGDVIFVGTRDTGESAAGVLPLLATTRAGQAGQVHLVSSEAWQRPVLQSQLLIVDQLAEILTATPLSCGPA